MAKLWHKTPSGSDMLSLSYVACSVPKHQPAFKVEVLTPRELYSCPPGLYLMNPDQALTYHYDLFDESLLH